MFSLSCKNQGQQKREVASSSGEPEELESGKARKGYSEPASFAVGAGLLHRNCCGLAVIETANKRA